VTFSTPGGGGASLRNPMVFGGVALIIGVTIGIIVALMVAGGGDNGTSSPAVRVDLTSSPSAEGNDEEARTGAAMTGKATATITVRSGPGSNYQVLGTLPKDKEVEIIGQSGEGEWLEVYFLPPSRLTGWVASSLIDMSGDLALVPVSTPEQFSAPEVPTAVPAVETPQVQPTSVSSETTVTATPEFGESPTPTPPGGEPDLIIGSALIVRTTLVITVKNVGEGELTERVVQVGVFDAADSRLLQMVNSGPYTLEPGESIDVPTGYDIRSGPPRLLVIVDPPGAIEETNDTNNRLVFTVPVGMTATPTPTLVGTPGLTPIPTTTPKPTLTPQPSPSPIAVTATGTPTPPS
jgi:uncharacterized protein YraI